MQQKILISGATGFVGRSFVRRWYEQFQLCCPSHTEMDIADEHAVRQYIERHQPDVVLHLAALSNTWYCEQHPEESFRVNVQGTAHVAKAAAAVGARLVYFSSDQVYNGNCEIGALSEDVVLSPENHYGRHKLLAEEAAWQASPDAVGLRATWMYAGNLPDMPQHTNFVTSFDSAIKEARSLSFAVREYRGITWLHDVVELLPHTFALPAGVYNFGAENPLNTYETALQYAEMLQTAIGRTSEVNPDNERYPLHPRNIAINTQKIRLASEGKIDFGTTLEGLQRYCATLKSH